MKTFIILLTIGVAIYTLIHNWLFKKDVKTVVNPIKIIIKTIAVILVCYGFSYTIEIPEKEYGLSYEELGCLAEGQPINDVEAMCKYLKISSSSSVKDIENAISNMKKNAWYDLQDAMETANIYWGCTCALLFIGIKPNNERTQSEPSSNLSKKLGLEQDLTPTPPAQQPKESDKEEN